MFSMVPSRCLSLFSFYYFCFCCWRAKKKGNYPDRAVPPQSKHAEKKDLLCESLAFFFPLEHKQTASWRTAPTLHLPLVRTHSTTHGPTVHSAGPWKRDFPAPHQKRPFRSEFQFTNSAELQRPQRDKPMWPPMYQHCGEALLATLFRGLWPNSKVQLSHGVLLSAGVS